MDNMYPRFKKQETPNKILQAELTTFLQYENKFYDCQDLKVDINLMIALVVAPKLRL
jgi:hypothetical protein